MSRQGRKCQPLQRVGGPDKDGQVAFAYSGYPTVFSRQQSALTQMVFHVRNIVAACRPHRRSIRTW